MSITPTQRDAPDALAGEIISASVEETFNIGARTGATLAGGEVILLNGALGAGKTVFVKGLASALGFDADEVTSPSFTLVNRYDAARLTLFHIDLYRLNEGATAAHAVDLDELLADERAVILCPPTSYVSALPATAKTRAASLSPANKSPARANAIPRTRLC